MLIGQPTIATIRRPSLPMPLTIVAFFLQCFKECAPANFNPSLVHACLPVCGNHFHFYDAASRTLRGRLSRGIEDDLVLRRACKNQETLAIRRETSGHPESRQPGPLAAGGSSYPRRDAQPPVGLGGIYLDTRNGIT